MAGGSTVVEGGALQMAAPAGKNLLGEILHIMLVLDCASPPVVCTRPLPELSKKQKASAVK